MKVIKRKSFNFSLLFFLYYCVQNGSSIMCYDCNSLYDPRCGEEFDSFSLGVVNCSLRDPLDHMPTLEPTLCRTIKMDISGKMRVVRQCGYVRDPSADESCQRRAGYHDLIITYCSCTTDLCNGATQVPTSQATLLTLTAVMCYWIIS